MIRLDPNLRWLYTELPMSQRMSAAAADGFEGIEVAFPYDMAAQDYRAALDRERLSLVQVLNPMDWAAGERGLAGLPGREADFRASMARAVHYAAQCGRPMIHAALGNMPAGVSPAACRESAIENLRWAADFAATQSLTVVIEACCTTRFPDFLVHSNAEAVALIDAVGRDNLKLCFDTHHVAMETPALLEDLAFAWPYIGHIQVGNAPLRHEPGEGELDIPGFIEVIARKGWDSWVGLEYTPRRSTTDSLAWARTLGLLPGGAR